ncbi:MAG: hypothetical protein WCO44_04165 [Bacteroidota bacterium]
MAEPFTSTTHRTSRSRNRIFHTDLYINYLKPALFITLAITLIVVAKIFHSGTKVATLGALCLIVLTVSKIRKFQFGVFLSMVCLVLMVMANIWHWADSFFVALFSGTIVTEKSLFSHGFVEDLLVLFSIIFYHNLLKNLNMHISHEWFVKKSQLKFLKMLTFFQLYLVFFWVAGYMVNDLKPGNHLDGQEVTMIAGGIALMAAGIPALIYFFRTPRSHSKHSRRHRHHHHSVDEG